MSNKNKLKVEKNTGNNYLYLLASGLFTLQAIFEYYGYFSDKGWGTYRGWTPPEECLILAIGCTIGMGYFLFRYMTSTKLH